MRGHATRAAFKPYGFDFETKPEVQTAHLCSYITDDGAVAAYMGVDREFVAKVRSELPRNEPVRFKANRNERYGEERRSSSGLQQDADARADAVRGSTKLFDKLTLAFQRHTDRYRIGRVNGMHPDEVSKLLLMNCQVRP